VHNAAAAASALWYRVGQVSGSTIEWSASHQYDTGFNPSVALSGSTVVEVHNAAAAASALWSRVGQVSGSTIAWSASYQYDTGFNPSVALSGSAVVEVHNAAAAASALWDRVGQVSGGGIAWDDRHQHYDQGFSPSVATVIPTSYISDDVTAIEVHAATAATGPLWYRIGPLATRVKTITLQPQMPLWISHYARFDGPVCGLDSRGLGVSQVFGFLATDQAVSGFDHFYERGDDPLPCVRKQEILYRGNVRFDLSQFDSMAGGFALLKFNLLKSIVNGRVNDPSPICNATTLGMATSSEPPSGDSHEGSHGGSWDFDNEVSLPACQPHVSVLVTSQVQKWLTNQHPSFGFVLVGPPLTFSSRDTSELASDNNNRASFYGDFQLEITFNRLVNPRAH
jgi:hypothetical protein